MTDITKEDLDGFNKKLDKIENNCAGKVFITIAITIISLAFTFLGIFIESYLLPKSEYEKQLSSAFGQKIGDYYVRTNEKIKPMQNIVLNFCKKDTELDIETVADYSEDIKKCVDNYPIIADDNIRDTMIKLNELTSVALFTSENRQFGSESHIKFCNDFNDLWIEFKSSLKNAAAIDRASL